MFKGLDLNSGWAWVATKNLHLGASIYSTNTPSGEVPETLMPPFSISIVTIGFCAMLCTSTFYICGGGCTIFSSEYAKHPERRGYGAPPPSNQ